MRMNPDVWKADMEDISQSDIQVVEKTGTVDLILENANNLTVYQHTVIRQLRDAVENIQNPDDQRRIRELIEFLEEYNKIIFTFHQQ